MAATNLMDYTLVVNRINYKGKYFKAFMITNANTKCCDKISGLLRIKKIIVVSDANISQEEAFNALTSFFGPIPSTQKDEAVTQWLKEYNSIDALSDMINEYHKDNRLNIAFHNALQDPDFNMDNIVIL